MTKSPNPHVLVAEDHPVNQKVLGIMLNMLSVQATFAENGQQAVDAVCNLDNSFSMILMDIMMPDVDGFAASFQIRQFEFERGLHTPIVACSALEKDNIKDQCIRSGIDDFINKPVGRDVLQRKIEHWVNVSLSTSVPESAIDRLSVRVQTSQALKEPPIDKVQLALIYGLEQLEDVLNLFMSVTETLMAQLESAIQDRDLAVMKRMTHEIKGSSYAVSAKEMSDLCVSLEHASNQKNWNEAERVYTALALAFARVREFLSYRAKELK